MAKFHTWERECISHEHLRYIDCSRQRIFQGKLRRSEGVPVCEVHRTVPENVHIHERRVQSEPYRVQYERLGIDIVTMKDEGACYSSLGHELSSSSALTVNQSILASLASPRLESIVLKQHAILISTQND